MTTCSTEPEIWKAIPGFETKYEVSNYGNIRSLDRSVEVLSKSGKNHKRVYKGKLLSPGRKKDGHLTVVLKKGSASYQVHQLVMTAFVGPTPHGKEILHADGNPANNKLENLRYGTRSENILDVFRIGKAWRKLTIPDVLEIKRKLKNGSTGAELAKEFNVSQSEISAIKKGVHYSWL